MKPFGQKVEGLLCLIGRLLYHVERSSIRVDLKEGIFAQLPQPMSALPFPQFKWIGPDRRRG
jgi:hypothetical protein